MATLAELVAVEGMAPNTVRDQVRLRVVLCLRPWYAVMDIQSSFIGPGTTHPAAIPIAFQDDSPDSQPAFLPRACLRSRRRLEDTGSMNAQTGPRAARRFVKAGRYDSVGLPADDTNNWYPRGRHSGTRLAAKARSPSRLTRVDIKGFLAGIASQMHLALTTFVAAFSGAKPCRWGHGFLEYREGLAAVYALQRSIGFRLPATHTHTLHRAELRIGFAIESLLGQYVGRGARKLLTALKAGSVNGIGTHSPIVPQQGVTS